MNELWECPVCLRAYGGSGAAALCHPASMTEKVDMDMEEVRAELKRKQQEYLETPVEETTWGDVVDTYETGAKRADGGKIRYDLMPIVAMRDTAQIWTFGAKKYGDRNWEKGFNWSGPYASMMRHLQAWFAGENFDAESGMSHLAHAACNLQMLQQFEYTHPEGDNRPKNSAPPIRRKK